VSNRTKGLFSFAMIFFLISGLICLMIDWDQVNEYNERYPNPAQMGACPPIKPFMIEQMVMAAMAALGFGGVMFTMVSICLDGSNDNSKKS